MPLHIATAEDVADPMSAPLMQRTKWILPEECPKHRQRHPQSFRLNHPDKQRALGVLAEEMEAGQTWIIAWIQQESRLGPELALLRP